MNIKLSAAAIALFGAFSGLLIAAPAFAQPWRSNQVPSYGFWRTQTHAGQLDHDGILSPGEIPNSGINYDRAQRQHERDGDYRVDNPENDAQAHEDWHGRHDDNHDRRHDDDEWNRDHHDHHDRDDHHGW